LKAADGVVQARFSVEEIVRSRSQDKGKPECACRLRGCVNPFDSQANIVKWTVSVASRILDRASNESHLGRKPDRFRYDFRCVAKTFFQIRRDGQIRGVDDQARLRQRLISRLPAIPSTNGRGGGSARCGQCLEAKAGENAGGADVPWIRNYEGARAVVKGAEASRLVVLGDTHRSCLAIRSPDSTPTATRMYRRHLVGNILIRKSNVVVSSKQNT
jgi:hypothetical protein